MCVHVYIQVREDKPFRLACGSFLEEYSNSVQIMQLDAEQVRDIYIYIYLFIPHHPHRALSFLSLCCARARNLCMNDTADEMHETLTVTICIYVYVYTGRIQV